MRKRMKIKLSRLVEIFGEVDKLSFTDRPDRSWHCDFSRSAEYLSNQGLQDHIVFPSFARRDKALPLNSERAKLEWEDVVVRHLDVELDDRLAWSAAGDWKAVPKAKLHFEDCRFRSSQPNMRAINFPWRGSFRFEGNEFCFPNGSHPGAWIFAFKSGSRVWFGGNDFSGNTVQTSCVSADQGEECSVKNGDIAFIGNRRVHEISFQDGFSSIEISGMNQIGRLSVNLTVDGDAGKRTSVYFGPRERIDPQFHYFMQHRSLFLTMRQLAAMNHDSRQLSVLNKQLERIEYFLNKNRGMPSLWSCRAWIGYWQDRALYGWRRWSSDFYRSWLRPLTMLVTGYLLINAAPMLVVESFGVSEWIDFTLRPVGEVASFEASLGRIVGREYEAVPACARSVLKLMGLIEVVWIGVWGFALVKAVKR